MSFQPLSIQPRWFQDEAVESLFGFYEQPRPLGDDGQPKAKNGLVCLPTGTGKSVVIAEFLKRALIRYPGTRVIMATHVADLISQNAERMQQTWPLAPLGVYSAGLNSRDFIQPIIFGGIKSMVNKLDETGKTIFGYRDFLVIDEAHLLADDGDYLKFIKQLLAVNPFLKVIGLTATPYRLGMGLMTNGKIFTDIVYDLCNLEGFNRLIAEGFLAPLVPPSRMPDGSALVSLDVSNVGMSKGDFNQGELETAVDRDEVNYAALKQLVEAGYNRRCWMVFASGVKHAEHLSEMLNGMFGVPTVCLHSKKGNGENKEALRAWKAGEVRCAVSMNKLTTGVDNPAVDLIGMLRPTMSTGLWVQMLGRGTRPVYAPGYDLSDYYQRHAAIQAGGKPNCLVLDFAGNTRRLGPINDPVIPRPKGEGPPGDAPVKICPSCGMYNNASARACFYCGAEFPVNVNLSRQAGTDELLRSNLPQIETFKVSRVVLTPHVGKKSGTNSIKVSYFCEPLRTFYEFISVEASAPLWRKKSRDWFRQRYHYSTPVHLRVRTGLGSNGQPDDVPAGNADVIALSPEFRHPTAIKVWVNKQQPEIMGHEF